MEIRFRRIYSYLELCGHGNAALLRGRQRVNGWREGMPAAVRCSSAISSPRLVAQQRNVVLPGGAASECLTDFGRDAGPIV